MAKTIAVRVYGNWKVVNRKCYYEHGPMNVCPRCVAK